MDSEVFLFDDLVPDVGCQIDAVTDIENTVLTKHHVDSSESQNARVNEVDCYEVEISEKDFSNNIIETDENERNNMSIVTESNINFEKKFNISVENNELVYNDLEFQSNKDPETLESIESFIKNSESNSSQKKLNISNKDQRRNINAKSVFLNSNASISNTLQFFVVENKKGFRQLFSNDGYRYTIHIKTANTIQWRCQKKGVNGRCLSYIKVANSGKYEQCKTHSHLPTREIPYEILFQCYSRRVEEFEWQNEYYRIVTSSFQFDSEIIRNYEYLGIAGKQGQRKLPAKKLQQNGQSKVLNQKRKRESTEEKLKIEENTDTEEDIEESDIQFKVVNRGKHNDILYDSLGYSYTQLDGFGAIWACGWGDECDAIVRYENVDFVLLHLHLHLPEQHVAEDIERLKLFPNFQSNCGEKRIKAEPDEEEQLKRFESGFIGCSEEEVSTTPKYNSKTSNSVKNSKSQKYLNKKVNKLKTKLNKNKKNSSKSKKKTPSSKNSSKRKISKNNTSKKCTSNLVKNEDDLPLVQVLKKNPTSNESSPEQRKITQKDRAQRFREVSTEILENMNIPLSIDLDDNFEFISMAVNVLRGNIPDIYNTNYIIQEVGSNYPLWRLFDSRSYMYTMPMGEGKILDQDGNVKWLCYGKTSVCEAMILLNDDNEFTIVSDHNHPANGEKFIKASIRANINFVINKPKGLMRSGRNIVKDAISHCTDILSFSEPEMISYTRFANLKKKYMAAQLNKQYNGGGQQGAEESDDGEQ